MASMATSSVKVLALVTILLAVFAQEAVEAKTRFLYWEVSPLSTSQLLKTCKKIFQCLLNSDIWAVLKLFKQSHKDPSLFLFSVEPYTHLQDQYWRHTQILTHSSVLLFFVIHGYTSHLLRAVGKSFGVGLICYV